MIKNKKLFFITVIVTVFLCLVIDVPILLSGIVTPLSLENALLFIGNAILAVVAYTLIYHSLEKTEIIKKIYKFILFIGSMIFAIGVIMLMMNL